ncbi:MAG TPA: SDR family oxidoreductase [Acidimicrobiia bacterium]|nr:SDR family oxidoreductase [Acidimicrobiia bacterium]
MTLPAPAPARTCVVTGASSGIGAEIARGLASRGLGVTLVARREDRLRALADEVATAHGVRAEVVTADLTDEASRTRILTEITERGLSVDMLVNNAGFSTTGPVSANDPAGEIAMLRTNVEAVAHLCSLFLPGMVERARGAILNVASTAAFQPLPGQAGYAASKAFVLSYSHAVRAELAGTPITVTVLCPGPVKTEFAEAAGFSEEESTGSLPAIMWESATDVATAGIDGVARGKAVVIPGAANKVSAAGGHLVPRSLLLPLLARQHPALRDTRNA